MPKLPPVSTCLASLVIAGIAAILTVAPAHSSPETAPPGIEDQLSRYAQLYARYGLYARAERVNVYGDDFRTRPEANLTDAEHAHYPGTAELVCPTAGVGKHSVTRSTVNYIGEGRFVGASHGVLPFDARIALGYRQFDISGSDPMAKRLSLHHVLKDPASLAEFERLVSRAFAVIVQACRVYLLDREGTVVDRLTLLAYKNGTNAVGLAAHAGDILVIHTSALNPYNREPRPSRLKPVTRKQAMNRPVSLYAFHTDLREQGIVKSRGRIRPFAPGHRHFASREIVGQDLDTHGGSSGALAYDDKGTAICMHLGSTAGQDVDRRSYDGKDRSNYCRLITQDLVDFAYSPDGWRQVAAQATKISDSAR